jgi:coniferyl-aldehyde dehydrogenase
MDAAIDSGLRLRALFAAQRAAWTTHAAPSVEERRDCLERLSHALYTAREAFVAALDGDYGGRARQETLLADLWPALRACRSNHRHVARWMRPRRRSVDLMLQRGRAWLRPQPLGVVGIVAPWNFPLLLSIGPLAAALAAGNRVMLKPSELTPRTAHLLGEVLANAFSPEEIAVIEGDSDVARAFVALPFDHLLFTGSTSVGREVMRSAAETLTPVTLELGGKSPALVTADTDLDAAAAALAFGKLINSGQACVAPDYVLAPRDKVEAFAMAMARAAQRLYPAWSGNSDYTAIINPRHRARLADMLNQARLQGARIVPLHDPTDEMFDSAGRMAPCLVIGADPASALLQEEIFGPILPVVAYDSLIQAFAFIRDRPRPLALYVFGRDDAVIRAVLAGTISGGVAINDTLIQVMADELPFGGVGASGMGQYHGVEGFDTFSKLKPVFVRRRPNLSRLLRPPYGAFADRTAALLLRLTRLKPGRRAK